MQVSPADAKMLAEELPEDAAIFVTASKDVFVKYSHLKALTKYEIAFLCAAVDEWLLNNTYYFSVYGELTKYHDAPDEVIWSVEWKIISGGKEYVTADQEDPLSPRLEAMREIVKRKERNHD